MTDDEGLRRRLFTVAARHDGSSETGSAPFRDGINQQIQDVTSWWLDPGLGDRRFDHEGDLDPRTPDEIRDFIADMKFHHADEDDAIVLYVTGHGRTSDWQRHVMQLPVTDSDALLRTGFVTDDLLGPVLMSRAENVLLIVDSCLAGVLHVSLTTLLHQMPPARRRLRTIAVLIHGHPDEKPNVGDFARWLARAVASLRDEEIVSAHLTLDDLFRALRATKGRHDLDVMQVWPVASSGESPPSPCLPNPNYRGTADVVAPSVQQVAPTRDEFAWWVKKASGRPRDGDVGWFFRGRARLTRALVSFLHDGEGVCVLAGSAGSGKSALIARVVTLADAQFRNEFAHVVADVDVTELPRLGAIDAAVTARDKTMDTVLIEIANLLGMTSENESLSAVETVRLALTQRESTTTLIVDGVDESRTIESLAAALGQVARARRPDGRRLVKLVVGVRRPSGEDVEGPIVELLRQAAFPDSEPGDLWQVHATDGVDSSADLTAYARAVLTTPGHAGTTPYSDTSALPVAQEIAHHVWPSFLDAGYAAAQLRDRPDAQATDDPRWIEILRQGTSRLFHADLHVVATEERIAVSHVLAVVRACAFAVGAGLPRGSIWPRVAEAVLGEPWTGPTDADDTIAVVLRSRLGGYLRQGVESDRRTWRPAHETLTEDLLLRADALMIPPTEDS